MREVPGAPKSICSNAAKPAEVILSFVQCSYPKRKKFIASGGVIKFFYLSVRKNKNSGQRKIFITLNPRRGIKIMMG